MVYLTKENFEEALESSASLTKLGLHHQQVLELVENIEISLRFFDTQVSIRTSSDCILKDVLDEFKKSLKYDRSIDMNVHRQYSNIPLNKKMTFQQLGITHGAILEISLI